MTSNYHSTVRSFRAARGGVWRVAVAGVALLVALGVTSLASADSGRPRLAYVLANGDYSNLGKLKNPVADGQLVANSLKAAGFTVTYLRNLDDQAFRHALIDIARESNRADVTLVYYAGHGVQIQGLNYLVPTDLPAPDSEEGVRIGSISAEEVLSVIKSPYKIVVLDACRDNPVISRALGHGRGVTYRRGLAPVALQPDAAGGIIVAYSTASDEVALDGEGANSPFAESFAANVGAKASVNDMFTNVIHDVLTKTKNIQRPFMYGSLDTVLCLPGECSAAATRSAAAQPPQAEDKAAPVVAKPPQPTTTVALEALFKQLAVLKAPEARFKIEQQLFQYFKASLPERIVYGDWIEESTKKAWAGTLLTASMTSDGHNAFATTEYAEFENSVVKLGGYQLDDQVLDCDQGERTFSRTRNGSLYRLYSKADQASKKAKVPTGSAAEGLLQIICWTPTRFIPYWAGDGLAWTNVGFGYSIAPSVVYSDPRTPDVHTVLARKVFDKPTAMGATMQYVWIPINCKTKEAGNPPSLDVSPGGIPLRVWSGTATWKAYATDSADANIFVILCDR